MVLEQHVVLVSSTANAPEDVALHEVVDVGAETIDDLRGQYHPMFLGRGEEHTSWSSHMFSWAIWPLALAKGSVEYQRM